MHTNINMSQIQPTQCKNGVKSGGNMMSEDEGQYDTTCYEMDL